MTEQQPSQGDESRLHPSLSGDDSAIGIDTGTQSINDGASDDPVTPTANGKPQAGSGDEHSVTDTESESAHDPQNDDDDEADNDDEDNDEDDDDQEEEGEDEEEEEEEEEEEPRLKYARLTQHLGGVYRNGDATSAFFVAGDKMIMGTHNGNIHVVQISTFQSIRVYHAHAASVTGISVSPFPSPLPADVLAQAKSQATNTAPGQSGHPGSAKSSQRPDASPAAKSRKQREPQQIPRTPSNDIYVATASMDGNVCVQHLIDMKDVQLRNFARPVQAVALSPEYKSDRTYLSGGLAGQLICTVGGGQGRSTSTTVGTAAATASGWLGTMGLGGNSGKDTVLHSGEGTISTIKWSLSGKYVAWLNEHGIKLMRSNLYLDSNFPDDAWKRIGHIDRPQTEDWEQMASVWRGRMEWIDEQAFGADDSAHSVSEALSSPTGDKTKSIASMKTGVERLLVGWGGTVWIIHVHPGGMGTGRNIGERSIGRAEIVKVLRMDCIISGISLYTQSLLLVLAYCLPDDDDDSDEDDVVHQASPAKSQKSKLSTGSEPAGGIRRRKNNQPPELRLIDLNSMSEVDRDGLSLSRYERLSSSDYHLGILPARNAASAVASSRGALEAIAGLGADVWNAAINPKSLFSSGASIMSKDSGEDGTGSKGSTTATVRPGQKPSTQSVHPNLIKPGAKIFIHSPYDCILATKRDLGDHLAWLIEHRHYEQAWELLDDNPDIVAAPDSLDETGPQTSARAQNRQDSKEVPDDASLADSIRPNPYSSAEKEKTQIGELWLQELVEEGKWARAGQICEKVLNTPDRWNKWVWTFASAKKFDEIADHLPSQPMVPPISTEVYEVILGHYLSKDKPRFKTFLARWPTELFDISTVTMALEKQLRYRDVIEDSIEGGEKGRDWRIVMESLAYLHEANGRFREALKCYIRLQDADCSFRLIREHHLAEAVADDIASFIGLRVPTDKVDKMSQDDLEAATSEAITLLVDEAQHGLVRPQTVVEQLLEQHLETYLYFYLRGLWKGEGIAEHSGENVERLMLDSRSLVDDFADLAVRLFATYRDQTLLMDLLRTSTSYTFDKAVRQCEIHSYFDELVYLYAKTGEVKKALYLIIDRLKNVHKAIDFAKEQDDPELWDNLLDYSMDKPKFIRGLLEQAGTAIDPITLVRRIPEGLEIPGLREGLTHMMREHEIQHSISSGVAKVLRSEVAAAQNELRAGRRKGIKYDIIVQARDHVDVEAKDVLTHAGGDKGELSHELPEHDHRVPKPGHCARCHEPFSEYEMETLLGYACGHVYHVSHLLEMLHGQGHGGDVDLGDGGGQGGQEGQKRFVGMKVMRARLLRDHVRGGCPVCHLRRS